MTSEYTIVDGLVDILVKTFENEGTTFRDELEITHRSSRDKASIQEYNSLSETTQSIAKKYSKQKTQFGNFDKAQKKKRSEVKESKEEVSDQLYEQMLASNSDTLDTEYRAIDPETGEPADYRISVKQSAKTKGVPKADVKLFIKNAVENTLCRLHENVSLEIAFSKKHCQYLLDGQFIEAFYDEVKTLMSDRMEQLQSHITYISLVKKKHAAHEDSLENENEYQEYNE